MSRVLTVLAVAWIAGFAWYGLTSVPQLPLDVSAADPATIDAQGGWSPDLAVRLDPLVPRENYEGLAIRPDEAGGYDVGPLRELADRYSEDNFRR